MTRVNFTIAFSPNLRSGINVFFCFLFISLSLSHPSFCQKAWKAQLSGTDKDLHSITFGAGQFVAVGENGIILTSSNGADWKTQKSGINTTLYKVIYGGGKFVAVGENAILLSTNGIEWITHQPEFNHRHLRGIAYGNGRYVAVAGFSGTLTSTDGISWTTQSSTNTNYLTGVSFGNNLFVAIGGKRSLRSLSTQNSGWTEINYSSPTGLSSQISVDFTDVTYGQGLYVAVGTKAILTSTDGISWTEFRNNALPYFYGISYSTHQFVAVGFDGAIRTSSNSIDWEIQSSHTAQILYGVGTDQKKFVAVGAGGTIVSSIIDSVSVDSMNSDKADSTGTERTSESLIVTKKNFGAKTDSPSSLNQIGQFPADSYWTELTGNAEKTDQAFAYPNPSESGRFKLILPKKALAFRVVTLQGEVVRKEAGPFSGTELDLSDLASGIYILHVETREGSQIIKLIRL